MPDTIRWAILGAGRIARKFASCLREVPDAQLIAVGSLSAERANALADEFGAPHRHASYEALAADPDVDVVYVCTRNPFHLDNIKLCLTAGKPVLCEKPFTLNAAEAAEAITLARERKLFLMEAMWTRCFPATAKLREWLAQGRIGELQLLQGDFGFRNDWKPEGRHLSVGLGGGALLDVGVYLVSFSSMVLGPPVHVAGDAHLGATGVDESCGMVLRHARGELSVLSAAIRTETAKQVTIFGTTGRLEVPCPFWKPNALTLTPLDGAPEHVEFPYPNFGYQFEQAEVMRCLRAGRLESDLMPLEETLSIMRTLDAIRAPWGLKYPTEKPPVGIA
ncbi:MAG: Gfo/Idh/MocA family oxidoreductase [Verrucomicrobia bacterium]|nr:Gfo/Idh/MocA family oxidoreductase [Verrucomicrobiota bacterium]